MKLQKDKSLKLDFKLEKDKEKSNYMDACTIDRNVKLANKLDCCFEPSIRCFLRNA